ncbi:MAG: hypothetical protein ABIQ17_01395 [Candidatus Limnocylindrales bacterium]
MPDLRAILISVGVGSGVAAYLTLFWHWPLVAGGGIGIILGGLALVGSLSIGQDPGEADAAWRDAAPDLLDPEAEPNQNPPPEIRERVQ